MSFEVIIRSVPEKDSNGKPYLLARWIMPGDLSDVQTIERTMANMDGVEQTEGVRLAKQPSGMARYDD